MSHVTQQVQIEAPQILFNVSTSGEYSSFSHQNLSPKQLAQRLNVPHSWVLDASKFGSGDPIPFLLLGKYKRYLWNSPELISWVHRRLVAPDEFRCAGVHQDADYDYLDSAAFAARLNISESWVRDQVRARALEPIPHFKFGKYVRFAVGSPELESWVESRIFSANNRAVSRALGKERVQ